MFGPRAHLVIPPPPRQILLKISAQLLWACSTPLHTHTYLYIRAYNRLDYRYRICTNYKHISLRLLRYTLSQDQDLTIGSCPKSQTAVQGSMCVRCWVTAGLDLEVPVMGILLSRISTALHVWTIGYFTFTLDDLLHIINEF